jgi:hypothetical protein
MEKKTKYKPLEVDDASPCMKCGSVQCAFCSEDVKSAVQGMKDFIKSPDKQYFLDLIDYYFPVFKEEKK